MARLDEIRKRVAETVTRPSADGHVYGSHSQAIHDRGMLLRLVEAQARLLKSAGMSDGMLEMVQEEVLSGSAPEIVT